MIQPKISLNQIGEYLNANPDRRKSIVHNAKYPKNFIVARYTTAKKIINNYIISGYDDEILMDGIKKLKEEHADSNFKEQNRILSIELLEGLQSSILPNLDNYTIEIFKGKNKKIKISGVQVSVNPDFIIRGKYRGKNVIGGVKLSIAKGKTITDNLADTITVLLKEFLEYHIAKDGELVKRDLCLSVDTFRNSFFSAPNAHKRRLSHISTACEEIAMRWKEIAE